MPSLGQQIMHMEDGNSQTRKYIHTYFYTTTTKTYTHIHIYKITQILKYRFNKMLEENINYQMSLFTNN